MKSADVVVIGAGPAGLAMSACLAAHGINHVVLERGQVGERWRRGSWDSLRLLTPNWLNRLPDRSYAGPDPNGYMTKDEFITYLTDYAGSFSAPVVANTDVTGVASDGANYRVETTQGTWRADAIVIATGQCETPLIPAIGGKLSAYFHQLHSSEYRSPEALARGGVLVVGASASGIQIAEELHQSGRQVILAAGHHTRLPRHYRGRDIMWWLDRLGMLDDRAADLPDLASARRQPSLQIAGRHEPALDLAHLRNAGVRVMGRAVDVSGTMMDFANDLAETTAIAERKLARTLARIDEGIRRWGIRAGASEQREPVLLESLAVRFDLAAAGVRSVIWATGYRPEYPWLDLPIVNEKGQILEHGGVTAAPGVYVLGLRWLRRRSSSFIQGIGRDAAELAWEVERFVAARRLKAA
jgi:putative flavoprotein involved in K+ transport